MAIDLTPALSAVQQQGWRLSEPCFDQLSLGGSGIIRAFAVAEHKGGASAITTAACLAEPNIEWAEQALRLRCTAQLIARIAALSLDQSSAYNSDQSSTSATGQSWQLCPHTGVGFGPSAAEASRRGGAAATAAHQLLSSWYGEAFGEVSAPQLAWGGSYTQQRITLPRRLISLDGHEAEVVSLGKVLKPKAEEQERVMVWAFAGGYSEAEAEAAVNEAVVDRLAFLAEEVELSRLPKFAPGRRYAAERFMQAQGRQLLEAWLAALKPSGKDQAPLALSTATLWPISKKADSFAVMKASGAGLLPVAYGKGVGAYERLHALAGKPGKAPDCHPWQG